MVSLGSLRPLVFTYSLAAATARSATGSWAEAGEAIESDAMERMRQNAADRSSLMSESSLVSAFPFPWSAQDFSSAVFF